MFILQSFQKKQRKDQMYETRVVSANKKAKLWYNNVCDSNILFHQWTDVMTESKTYI